MVRRGCVLQLGIQVFVKNLGEACNANLVVQPMKTDERFNNASDYLDKMLENKEEMNDAIVYFSSTLPTLLRKRSDSHPEDSSSISKLSWRRAGRRAL